MGKRKAASAQTQRIDEVRVEITNPDEVPVTLFAREDVHVEDDGIEQALEFVSIQRDVRDLYDRQRRGEIAPFFGQEPALERVVLTPDFHRAGGIPVGTVAATRGFIIPQAVGNDICCGMRLIVTDLEREDLERHEQRLLTRLREIFFEGQRQIPMSPRQREALLRDGLAGLNERAGANAGEGVWREYDPRAQREDLARVHFGGALAARGTFAFGDYIEASGRRDGRDSQIGSVGGGNHFVELQLVEEVLDHHAAHAWGVSPGKVALMVHSGSVGLGHMVGRRFLERARRMYPRGVAHPACGFYALPSEGPRAEVFEAYVDAMRNAANFAFGNRLMLGLMALRALREVTGKEPGARLIYDAPHNLIWDEEVGGQRRFVHRKGACPAYGLEPEAGEPFGYTGPPVIIPGSMGDSSWLLAGRGLEGALCSACHGAGRKLSRGAARHLPEREVEASLGPLRVVTPVDLDGVQLRMRPDIRERYLDRLKEEGPRSYKDVTPVVQTVVDAGIAARVARLSPWATIKGL